MSQKIIALSLIVALVFAFGVQAFAADHELMAATRDGRANVNMNDNRMNPMTDDPGMNGMMRDGLNDGTRVNNTDTGMRGFNDGFRTTAAADETNWGWLGLLGLIGLAGLFGRNRAEGERR